MKLTKYGRREVIVATVAAAAAVAVAAVTMPLVAPVPLVIWAGVLWFFRDPNRRAPTDEGVFVSPADGRVADITHLGPESDLGRNAVQVGIFMNVFDVHVNRSPAHARTVALKYRKGAFLDARDVHASTKNESSTIHMAYRHRGEEFPIMVRQIAGLIARRIVTDLTEGQELSCGERIGMIKFGSRVELIVPSELSGDIRVEIGQRVRAGETVLIAAGWEKPDER